MDTLTPWFWLVESRHLLRQCAENPPAIVKHDERFGRKVDVWKTYDPDDARVARLKAILVHHCQPILDDQRMYWRAIEAGSFVSVEMAIDAVLPGGPLIGNCNDPGYMAALPTIDLEWGRAAA